MYANNKQLVNSENCPYTEVLPSNMKIVWQVLISLISL